MIDPETFERLRGEARWYMREQECPKCDNVVNPRWHMGYAEGRSKRKPKELFSPTCKENDANKSGDEHLHFYCKCGYDFVMSIKEGKEDKIIET